MAPRAPSILDDSSLASNPSSPLRPKAGKATAEKQKTRDQSRGDKILKGRVEKAAKVKTDKGENKMENEKGLKKNGEAGKEGKEKVKAVVGEEAMELMVGYLKEQNRPYSATEISANLHGKVTKTVADKLLKEMEQKGLIQAKATNGDKKGSQWVFWATQDPADTASPEQLTAMDNAITHLRETLPSLKSELKSITAKLACLKSTMTTAELAVLVSTLQGKKLESEERLREFQGGGVQMITAEEVVRVESQLAYWSGKRRARKMAFQNLEAELLVGMERGEVWERAGCEEDTYE